MDLSFLIYHTKNGMLSQTFWFYRVEEHFTKFFHTTCLGKTVWSCLFHWTVTVMSKQISLFLLFWICQCRINRSKYCKFFLYQSFFFIMLVFGSRVVDGSLWNNVTRWCVIFWRRGDTILGLKPVLFVFGQSYIHKKKLQNGQATLVSSWKNLLKKLNGEGGSKWAGILKGKHDMIISLH